MFDGSIQQFFALCGELLLTVRLRNDRWVHTSLYADSFRSG